MRKLAMISGVAGAVGLLVLGCSSDTDGEGPLGSQDGSGSSSMGGSSGGKTGGGDASGGDSMGGASGGNSMGGASSGDTGGADASGGSSPGGTGGTDDPGDDCGPDINTGLSSTRHTAREIGYQGSPRGYYEYLPPSYRDDCGAGSPLLLFFHGLGENGNGELPALDKVVVNGPPKFIEDDSWPEDRPFVVLSSQQAGGCPNATQIDDFLNWAVDEYNVDSTHLYLTGLSCGAIGVANYLRVNVDTTPVAAAVVISGDLRSAWNQKSCDLGRVALWGIHGEEDKNAGTPPDGTRIPMEGLLECPPEREARLNMLPDVGHSGATWNATYSGANGLDIYPWLLSFSR